MTILSVCLAPGVTPSALCVLSTEGSVVMLHKVIRPVWSESGQSASPRASLPLHSCVLSMEGSVVMLREVIRPVWSESGQSASPRASLTLHSVSSVWRGLW